MLNNLSLNPLYLLATFAFRTAIAIALRLPTITQSWRASDGGVEQVAP